MMAGGDAIVRDFGALRFIGGPICPIVTGPGKLPRRHWIVGVRLKLDLRLVKGGLGALSEHFFPRLVGKERPGGQKSEKGNKKEAIKWYENAKGLINDENLIKEINERIKLLQ